MQKNNNLQKFLTVSFIVLSFLFVLLFLLLVFNGSIGESFASDVQGNKLVHVIIISLSVLYFGNAVWLFKIAFFDKETIDSVTIVTSQHSATKVAKKTIVDIVKHNTKFVEGVTVKGVDIRMTDKNDYKLDVAVKVSGIARVDHVVECYRRILFNAFSEILGVTFSSIDFKVEVKKPKYTPDIETIESELDSLAEKRDRFRDMEDNLSDQGDVINREKLNEESELREQEIDSAATEDSVDEQPEEPVEIAPEEEVQEVAPEEEKEEQVEENNQNQDIDNKGDQE